MSNALLPESRLDTLKNQDIITPDMRDFMVSKLGMREDDITSIIPDDTFAQELQNLMQNPENQTEKMIFLGKYIYDRIIAEAQKQGRDPLEIAQEKKKNDDFIIGLDSYVNNKNKQAAITRANNEKRIDEAAMADEARIGKKQEQLIEKDKLAKEYTTLAKAEMKPEGQVVLSEEVTKAKQDENFIKKLEEKGYKKEDIQSDKFNDTITGYVLAERGQEFIAKGYVTNVEKFESAIKNTKDVLGIPQVLDKSLGDLPIAKGPRRDQIISEGTKLVESGKYNDKNITYNSETGRIRFEPKNPNASVAEIDTSVIPPKLEYIKNGLSISRDIEPVDPQEEEKKQKERDLAEKKNTRVGAESAYFGTLATPESKVKYDTLIKDTETAELISQKDKLLRDYMSLDNTSQKIEKIKDVKDILTKMNSRRSTILGLDTSTEQKEIIDTIESTVNQESLSLDMLSRRLSEELQAEKDLPRVTPTKDIDSVFESAAAYNLNFLSYIGYDTLGQDGLERIIERLNHPNNPRRSETGTIELTQKLDTPKTQALTLAIANLVRGGRQSGATTIPEQVKQEKEQKTWDGVDKTDPIIAARQTQSFGFRDSLLSVRRNMTQEGGSLKTRGQLDKALFGIESVPEKNDSSINTIETTGNKLA